MFFNWKKNTTPLIDIMKGDTDAPKPPECSVPEDPWSQKQLVMEEGTDHLCRELSCSVKTFKCQEWAANLDKYIAEHERLLYASITNYIFGLDDKAFTTFLTNLDAVIEAEMAQKATTESSKKRRRTLVKFRDHVNLARMQLTLFSQRQADIDLAIDRRLEPALAKSSKELTSQLVGLVAIFTALSFIVFGGISSLESLFGSLSQNADSILPVIITAIAWAFCILNLLFAFMYFVMRIIGMLPKTDEKKGNLVQRYPMVFLSNYCLLASFLLCSGAFFAQQTGIGRGYYDFALENSDATFVWGLLAILLVLVITGVILVRMYLHKSKEAQLTADQVQE